MNLIRDLFATLFFVAIGMLLEPDVIIRDAAPVAALLVILIVGKLLVIGGALLIAGVSRRISTLSAALLAQMGEFSFVLAGVGLADGIIRNDH